MGGRRKKKENVWPPLSVPAPFSRDAATGLLSGAKFNIFGEDEEGAGGRTKSGNSGKAAALFVCRRISLPVLRAGRD